MWSGATGEAKCLPGRSQKACKHRLSEIKKQMDKKDKDYWIKISRAHKHAPHLVETLNKIMEDVDWQGVPRAIAQLSKLVKAFSAGFKAGRREGGWQGVPQL